jgi:hypothetical protein
MQIGSSVSRISPNMWVRPNYPENPVQAVQKVNINRNTTMPISNLGIKATIQALNQKNISPSNILLTLPGGGMIVGTFIDIMA